MKHLRVILIMLTTAYLTTPIYPSIVLMALVPMVVAILMRLGQLEAALDGFVAVGLLWGIAAVFANVVNDGLLPMRIKTMLHLPHESLLVVVTILVGGLAGAMGGWAGSSLRQLLQFDDQLPNL